VSIVTVDILPAIHLEALTVPLALLWLFGALAYRPYFWVTWGQTPGQRVMQIKVVRRDGRSLSWGRAIARYLGYYVSALPLYLGFLWVLWDPHKQGFHDKIADTVVVRAA
jgi:uncharacterized RDD family membrane protein YckC